MHATLPIDDSPVISDDSDRATWLEEQFNAAALDQARQRAAPETHADFDGKHCVDCGEIIPKGRRELGKVRCISCQQAIELRDKQHAHN
jgi:RNA polymerase-binding transcription factor DksA